MLLKARLEHFPVLKRRSQYKDGNQYKYSDYRLEIREDCEYRCVYCDAHEEEIGGESIFHLDHFRPQKYFPDLIDAPINLVWACCRCNLLKREHWPALNLSKDETINGENGFIDPFAVDRKDYFVVSDGGRLAGLKPPGNYLIKKLALNRPFLCLNRYKRELVHITLQDLDVKEAKIHDKKVRCEQRLSNNDFNDIDDIKELIIAYSEMLQIIADFRSMLTALL